MVTCPFCKTDNKCRKDAEHIVCFKCKHSFSVLQDEPKPNPRPAVNFPKSRVNDMFFPDPMNYPGYYPGMYPFQQPHFGGYNHCGQPLHDMLLHRKPFYDQESRESLRRKYDNRADLLPRRRGFGLGEFISTVDDVHLNTRLNGGRSPYLKKTYALMGGSKVPTNHEFARRKTPVNFTSEPFKQDYLREADSMSDRRTVNGHDYNKYIDNGYTGYKRDLMN